MVAVEMRKTTAPLTNAIIVTASQLVDDAQCARRDPSHSDLEFHIKRAGLTAGDPISPGQTVGKAKRVRATLNWALAYPSRNWVVHLKAETMNRLSSYCHHRSNDVA
jgi:hypothetical protein